MALTRLLVQVIRPSHTHSFLNVQFMFLSVTDGTVRGVYFRPSSTYRSKHLLLDHQPAFAILTNEALGFELGAKKVIEVRPALEADAGFSRLAFHSSPVRS